MKRGGGKTSGSISASYQRPGSNPWLSFTRKPSFHHGYSRLPRWQQILGRRAGAGPFILTPGSRNNNLSSSGYTNLPCRRGLWVRRGPELWSTPCREKTRTGRPSQSREARDGLPKRRPGTSMRRRKAVGYREQCYRHQLAPRVPHDALPGHDHIRSPHAPAGRVH